MACGVGIEPAKSLRIRTFGVAGSTSQEALGEVKEGCDTISGTHDTGDGLPGELACILGGMV